MSHAPEMRDAVHLLILSHRMSSAETITDEVMALLTQAVTSAYTETVRAALSMFEEGEADLTDAEFRSQYWRVADDLRTSLVAARLPRRTP